jgi:hypothetical protein
VALDVDRVDVSGVWFRHIPHGADPLARPSPPPDNRWQRGRIVDALYLADDEATLWAEWYRHLAEIGLPPLRQLPRDRWRFRVPALEAADLRDAARLGRVGLTPPVPGRRTWPGYQRIGETLWREGWPGLVSSSAARPDGLVLCLFVSGPMRARPLRPPKVVAEPPAPPTGMRT